MEIIKWANGKGQKLILSEGEAEELREAINLAMRYSVYDAKSEGECGRFEVIVEH